MASRHLTTAFALFWTLAAACTASGQTMADPLARLHAGAGQWDASQSAVVPASYPVAPVQLPPPPNELPPPDQVWPAPSGPGTAWGPPPGEMQIVEPPEAQPLYCWRDELYCNRSWLFAVEFVPAESHLTRAEFGDWPDNKGLAMRFLFGYEGVRGLGVRGRLGIFAQDFEFNDPLRPWIEELELFASTFNLDFYKRLLLDDAEIILGVGPAAGGLGFELIHDDSSSHESRFSGGGISGFVEGWHRLWRLERADIGLVGRGRLTLLAGDWEDDTGFIIPETDEDSMTIFELAWGFEVRRPFGKHLDKYWYATWLLEHQTRESPWMARFAGTSVALTGVNMSVGLAW